MKFNFDANAIWAYAELSRCTAAGYTLNAYAEGFVYALERYLQAYGEIGKEYLKNAVPKNEIILAVNEKGMSGSYISSDVKDGVFRILFREDSLGCNSSSLYDSFPTAIENVPVEGFSLFAQHSVVEKYEAVVEDLRVEIGQILNTPDVVLDPNFKENYAALSAKKPDMKWKPNFGNAAYEYFDAVKYQLERQGFKDDEMLQEGFAEGVTSKIIKIRIVEKVKGYGYIESALEDGVVYIQMKADSWYCNVSDAGSGILELL